MAKDRVWSLGFWVFGVWGSFWLFWMFVFSNCWVLFAVFCVFGVNQYRATQGFGWASGLGSSNERFGGSDFSVEGLQAGPSGPEMRKAFELRQHGPTFPSNA